MGACASIPNVNDVKDEDAPFEAPTPKKTEVEVVTQEENKEGSEKKDEALIVENKEGGEKKDEPLLIDLSDEPKVEEEKKAEEPSEPAAPASVAEAATDTKELAEQPSEAPVSKDQSDE